MPIRFSEVEPNILYRGGALEPWEIKILKDVYDIEQIISLDKESGQKIHDECKDNNINHIIISIEDGVNDNSHIIKELGINKILKNFCSYVHCYHGKDRTGLFVAKFRIENGWSFDDAMKEALSFGFGSGMDKEIVDNYIKIISDDNYKIENNNLCESCGMLKNNNICKTCEYVGETLIKLKANKTIVDESRESPMNYQGIDEAGDNRVVSDALNVPEQKVDTVSIASYFRQNIIKYLMKKELLKQAVDQDRITFKVPAKEKKKAKIALTELESLTTESLRVFIDHLDLMYEPFNEHKGITPEQATNAAIHIDNFGSVVEENLTKIKKRIFIIMETLKGFDSDTTIYSMLNSLDDSINSINSIVSNFIDILTKKDSINFQENTIKAIEIIKKETAQLKQLCDESITQYIKDNIILEDWTTEIEKEISEEEEEQDI